MPMHKPIVLNTIQDFIDHEHGITLHCESCRHYARMDVEAVAKRLGPTTECGGKGSAFLRHFVCSKCGSKDLSIRINYIHAGRRSNASLGRE